MNVTSGTSEEATATKNLYIFFNNSKKNNLEIEGIKNGSLVICEANKIK
jgi:hypothetical protein